MSAVPRILNLFRPDRLGGPILHKELRVSSRRLRSYALRTVYVLLLTGFVALSWLSAEQSGRRSDGAYSASRMAVIGQSVTTAIIWFQFIALQLVAVAMCSTSISDEINRRTLPTLMTTPITSMQIVVGKMFSRLFQLLLLLAVSLPLLAVVRIFGGVPWEFVLSGTCITATAVLFAGSVSMYFSVGGRSAYSVILSTLLFGLLYLVGAPLVLGIMGGILGGPFFLIFLMLCNPFVILGLQSAQMAWAGGSGGFWGWLWLIHCAVMLGLSITALTVCSIRLRRIALREFVGPRIGPIPPAPWPAPMVALPVAPIAIQVDAVPVEALPAGPVPVLTPAPASSPPNIMGVVPDWTRLQPAPPRLGDARPSDRTDSLSGPIRPVTGSPVAWRELLQPWFRGQRGIITLCVLGGAVGTLYYMFGVFGAFSYSPTHSIACSIFMVVALLDVATMAGATIAREKEANTWPILLTTPLTNWQIVRDKLLGVLRRSLAAWSFLVLHLLLFTLFGMVHWLATLLVLWLCISATLFTAAMGIFFSAGYRRTSAAVAMTLFTAVSLWLLLPVGYSWMHSVAPIAAHPGVSLIVGANPVYQVGNILWHASGIESSFLGLGTARKAGEFLALASRGAILLGLAYLLLAGLLLLGACRRVRRKILPR